jgi:hypothetical protein
VAHPRTLPVVTGAARRTAFLVLARRRLSSAEATPVVFAERIQRAARRSERIMDGKVFFSSFGFRLRVESFIAPFSSFCSGFFFRLIATG